MVSLGDGCVCYLLCAQLALLFFLWEGGVYRVCAVFSLSCLDVLLRVFVLESQS